MTCEIPLACGRIAVVDADVYPRVARFRWACTGGGHVGRHAIVSGAHVFIYLHRQVLERELNLDRTLHCHHRNENKLDNRCENLALIDQGEHRRLHAAAAGPRGPNAWKGVWQHGRGHWYARISHQGRRYDLGSFPADQLDAALEARDRAALALYGPTCYLNQPEKYGLPAHPEPGQ